MKSSKLLLLIASAAATFVLGACGGGNDPVTVPAGATGGSVGGGVTGPIANIVGDYNVVVAKADCTASDSTPTIKIEPQANGSCKITSSVAGTVVEFRRDILPVGAYKLRIAADGSLEMLQGTVSKAKVSCPGSAVCAVNGTAAFTTYTIAGGTGSGSGATVGISQLIITTTGTVKSVLSGVFYGLGGNVTYAGTTPVLAGESGVLVFAAP